MIITNQKIRVAALIFLLAQFCLFQVIDKTIKRKETIAKNH